MSKTVNDNIDTIVKQFFEDRTNPVHFLVGTDWWTDCDDCVAMRVLAWAQHSELIKIEAVGINACMEFSAPSLDAFLTAEGLPNTKIGIDKDATDFGGAPPYQKRMVTYPHTCLKNDDCEDGVKVYREVLANCKDKVNVIEIGYPQLLSNLLKSKGDEISPLTGLELVKNKVKKLWMMAGNWENMDSGFENNFARNQRSRAAGHYVCENWPTPVTFLGWEISSMILTGDTLSSSNDILYQAMCDHGSSKGRSSWDPMLVFLAICQDEERAGYSIVKGKAFVDAETGENSFEENACGDHCFVKKEMPDSFYKDVINQILVYK